MLRRRRQLLPGLGGSEGEKDTLSMEGATQLNLKTGSNKLKMSPFPEVKGVPLRESSSKLNQLSEVSTSLQFTDVDCPVEIGISATLTNTPVPHTLKHIQTHPLDVTTTSAEHTTTEPKPVDTTLSPRSTGNGQAHDSCAMNSKPNPTFRNLRIQIPKTEDVMSNTMSSVASAGSVNIGMGSFPPPVQQDRASHVRKHTNSTNVDVERESTIRPSNVLELERQLMPKASRQQTMSKGGSDGPVAVKEKGQSASQSASITGMWDNVVSWMKQAMDFVTDDNSTEEAYPTTASNAQGKKRPRQDSNVSEDTSEVKMVKLTDAGEKQRERCVATSRQRKSRSSQMSLGGQTTRANEEGLSQLLTFNLLPSKEPITPRESISTSKLNTSNAASGTFRDSVNRCTQSPPVHLQPLSQFVSPTTQLVQQFSHGLAVTSPQEAPSNPLTASSVNNKSLLTFVAKKYKLADNGLNSILDGSPFTGAGFGARKQAPRICRRSVYTPNVTEMPGELMTVRRSPRLAENGVKTPPTKVPVPPPPPPVPSTPQTYVPPPPKLPSLYDCDLSSTPSRGNSGADKSRHMLQNMQNRLRTRMKRKAVKVGEGCESRERKPKELNIKGQQWAEIQALTRKISLSEFLAMAEREKQEIKRTLEDLRVKVPGTIAEISKALELLHDASQWFSGGNKEMRESLPLYKSLEKKIDVLHEFTLVCNHIQESSLVEAPESVHYSKLHSSLSHIRSEFDGKHRHWGAIVLTNAQSWSEYSLPVCHKLLLRARQYLCHLVKLFVTCTLVEADKMEGILVSLKCIRTSQLLDRLRECMQLLIDSQPYFLATPFEQICDSCEICQSHSVITNDDDESVNHLESALLKFAVDVSISYINICLAQFDGFIKQLGRQEVCEHFESILKMINLVKSLVCVVNNIRPSHVKTSGIVSFLPEGEPLGTVIYTSCVILIQYIMSQTRSFVSQEHSPESDGNFSKEVILWMMFGCKYVHQTLEVLGSETADKRGVGNLLVELQQMEDLLPN